MTPEMMAEVVFENYDPEFAGRRAERRHARRRLELRHRLQPRAGRHRAAGQGHRPGHRRQLLPDLPAQRLQQRLPLHRLPRAGRAACASCTAREIGSGEQDDHPGDEIEVDFSSGTITYRGETFRFPPLGTVPQALVVAGGVENQVRRSSGSIERGSRSRSQIRTTRISMEGRKRNMAKHTVVTMPGDGIGKTVLPEALRVLDAVGFDAEYVHADIGWEFWVNEGNPLPERTIELLAEHKLGLFGAITSKPKPEAAAELSPELRDKGLVYFSPIVAHAPALQPRRLHPPLPLVPRQPAELHPPHRGRRLRGAAGRRGDLPPEHRGPVRRRRVDRPAGSRCATRWRTHPKFKAFADTPGEDLAICTRDLHARAPAAASCTAGLRVRQEARLQVGDGLREAQRAARDLGHDGRGRQRGRRRTTPTSSSGRPTSTPR